MTSFSTLPETQGQDYREIVLSIAPGYAAEVDEVLEGLRKKFPIIEVQERQ